MSEANLLAILESLNELVHLEFLTDPKLQRILDFSSLKNLLSNELFLSFIYFYYFLAFSSASHTASLNSLLETVAPDTASTSFGSCTSTNLSA